MGNIKIAISGDLGSGKSVLAKCLQRELGFEIISIGVIQRELAAKYGMDALEFNRFMETHPEIDIECDNMVIALGKEDRGLILDSRLAWHFIPHAFKIHLLCDAKTAGQRVFQDNIRKNEKYSSVEDATQKLIDRRNSEVLRYKTLYGVSIDDMNNYNCVIETTDKTPEYIFQEVISQYREWLGKNID